ncbi:hypothetical protein P7H79_13455, partial [Lactococcus lactis]|uniref:hypothetical protein n=1 Tax=Lactococcus lactis TaxID=1358 RepID=UPI002890FCC3
SSFLLLSFSIILPYLIVDLKLCNRTILGNQVLILTDTTKTREILNLRVYNVSNAGRELFNIINSSTDNDYNKALGYELENTLGESISVSLSNIISISPNGGIEIEEENLLRKES